MMPELNLPAFDIQLTQRDGKLQVWDILRQRFVRLTPEEWVRQHFVHYMINELGYPSSLLMNEVSLMVEGLSRRSDSVLYDRQLRPIMLIEYKAPSIPLGPKVLEQIVRYNYTMRVPYLILSNGLEHQAYYIDYDAMKYEVLTQIPEYASLRV